MSQAHHCGSGPEFTPAGDRSTLSSQGSCETPIAASLSCLWNKGHREGTRLHPITQWLQPGLLGNMTHLLGRCGRLHACMNVWGWGVEFLCMCCVCARPYSVSETFKVTAGSFVFLHVRLCSERISLRKHSLQCPPLCTLFTRHPSGNTHRITMRTGIAYRQQHSDTPPPTQTTH